MIRGCLVDGWQVADTTSDPAWYPVVVVATLAEPVVTVADQLHLDGVVSWGAFVQARRRRVVLPPLRADRPPVDFAMPFATWTAPAPEGVDASLLNSQGEVWGWACSRAHYQPAGWTTAHTRKAPPVQEFARYTTDRKYHGALGPHKARNAAHQAALVDKVTWRALADPDQLTDMLRDVHNVGRLVRHGWGRVLHWRVYPDTDRDAWRDRDMPGQGTTIRAPYWHSARRA